MPEMPDQFSVPLQVLTYFFSLPYLPSPHHTIPYRPIHPVLHSFLSLPFLPSRPFHPRFFFAFPLLHFISIRFIVLSVLRGSRKRSGTSLSQKRTARERSSGSRPESGAGGGTGRRASCRQYGLARERSCGRYPVPRRALQVAALATK